MTETEVFDVLKKHILEQLEDEVDEAEIDIEKSMSDLGANSLDNVEIVTNTMRELKIKIPRDELGTIMVFPSETSFLLPAVAPGEVALTFRPRGPGERVAKILHQGRDILETGLTVEAGQDITGVTIVIRSSSQPPSSSG